jgi:hypothetical protein
MSMSGGKNNVKSYTVIIMIEWTPFKINMIQKVYSKWPKYYPAS